MDIAFFLKDIAGFTFKTLPADVRILKGDLEKDQDLQTAILLSLFTNRRAEPTDKISGNNMGGWWGNKYINAINSNQQSNPKLGSRLWLLKRGKITRDTLNFAKIYANESLQWLVDDKVITNVIIDAAAFKNEGIILNITVVKPSSDQLNFSYGYLWNQIENK